MMDRTAEKEKTARNVLTVCSCATLWASRTNDGLSATRANLRGNDSMDAGRCSWRFWPPRCFETAISAHIINTFEVGRIYQNLKNLFEEFWSAAFTPLQTPQLHA